MIGAPGNLRENYMPGNAARGAWDLQRAHGERLGLGRDARRAAGTGRSEDRPGVCRRAEGSGGVISTVFPGTPLQRCTTHLKRNLLGGVHNGDKGELAEDLRQLFRTGDRSYTVERAWEQWQTLCEQRGQDYRSFRRRGEDPAYKAYSTYLNYEARIQSMICTTNWIECLQKDFRRVTRMRGAMPNEGSVLLLMGKTAMDKKSYLKPVFRMDRQHGQEDLRRGDGPETLPAKAPQQLVGAEHGALPPHGAAGADDRCGTGRIAGYGRSRIHH